MDRLVRRLVRIFKEILYFFNIFKEATGDELVGNDTPPYACVSLVQTQLLTHPGQCPLDSFWQLFFFPRFIQASVTENCCRSTQPWASDLCYVSSVTMAGASRCANANIIRLERKEQSRGRIETYQVYSYGGDLPYALGHLQTFFCIIHVVVCMRMSSTDSCA